MIAEERVHLDLPSSWISIALVIGVIGAVGCVVAYITNTDLFLHAYLVVYCICLALCLGCLVLGMIGYLTTATWATAFTPVLESATKALPLVALFFLPVLVGLPKVYPWANATVQKSHMNGTLTREQGKDVFTPGLSANEIKELEDSKNERVAELAFDRTLYYKVMYFLNPQFFIIRAIIYFVIWNLVALIVRYLARKWEASGSLAASRRLRKFCGFGMVVYGATFTFASIDWFMSLEPKWWSAIYSVIFAIGQFLTAYAFSVIVFLSLVLRAPATPPAEGQPAGPPSGRISQQLMRDFGNLLLTFTIMWTYMNFCQYLLIYSGNLKEEAVWYRPRMMDGWQYLIITICVTQFGLPLFLLLNKELKRNPRTLLAIAILIFASRFLDVTWQLVPGYEGDKVALIWMLPLALAGLGGLWAALFLQQLRRRVLVLKLAGLDAEAHAHE